jgi:hypothetical protein
MDDVKKKLDGFLGVGLNDRFCLNPFGELVHHDEQAGEATRSLLERPDHVETPDREQLCEGDGLKRLRWQVGLPGIELVPLSRADNFFRAVQCSRPIKTLAKGLANQRPRGCMVPTDASVDLQEEAPLV